eukprot:TRINITY_DN76388_c0_g1_i1.p1 TRINITY_DN76388_c0_g1~~TRINITY_DN76388_c0_g1_i1.p1  ORF type:complete len:616 (+),score=92.41 TRINITY_DN76388_c0_g1_i1:177-2024(+)
MSPPECSTAMLLHVNMPALDIQWSFQFTVDSGSSNRLLEDVELSLEDTCKRFRRELVVDDRDSSPEKLKDIRERAVASLRDWERKVRDAEEMSVKLEHAKEHLESMRAAYLKELTFLREQVYEKEKARKAGKSSTFAPVQFRCFDPYERSTDEEVHQSGLTAAKIEELSQQFEQQQHVIEGLFKNVPSAKQELLNELIAQCGAQRKLIRAFVEGRNSVPEAQRPSTSSDGSSSSSVASGSMSRTLTFKGAGSLKRMFSTISSRAKSAVGTVMKSKSLSSRVQRKGTTGSNIADTDELISQALEVLHEGEDTHQKALGKCDVAVETDISADRLADAFAHLEGRTEHEWKQLLRGARKSCLCFSEVACQTDGKSDEHLSNSLHMPDSKDVLANEDCNDILVDEIVDGSASVLAVSGENQSEVMRPVPDELAGTNACDVNTTLAASAPAASGVNQNEDERSVRDELADPSACILNSTSMDAPDLLDQDAFDELLKAVEEPNEQLRDVSELEQQQVGTKDGVDVDRSMSPLEKLLAVEDPHHLHGKPGSHLIPHGHIDHHDPHGAHAHGGKLRKGSARTPSMSSGPDLDGLNSLVRNSGLASHAPAKQQAQGKRVSGRL